MLPSAFCDTFIAPPNLTKIEQIFSIAVERDPPYLTEFEAYDLFKLVDINIPSYAYYELKSVNSAKTEFLLPGKNYVAKCHIPNCLHKTDIGGVLLNVNVENFDEKIPKFIKNLANYELQGVIFVEMVKFSRSNISQGEILVSALTDEMFGPQICFGMGGTGVEFYSEIMKNSSVFLPVFLDFDQKYAKNQILQTPLAKFLTGKVRGFDQEITEEKLFKFIKNVANLIKYFSKWNENSKFILNEIEMNPVVVSDSNLIALDAVVSVSRRQPTPKQGKDLTKLDYLFAPKTVLIAGVSSKNESSPGTVILRKFQHLPCQVVILHPYSDEIFGHKCYKSIDEIVAKCGQIDLAVLATSAEPTCELIKELVAKNACKAVFTLAGGFAETEKGAESEKQLRKMLIETENRPIINGPNTVGYKYVSADGVETNTIFLPSYKSSGENSTGHTNTAIIAQSGAFLLSRVSNLAGRVAPKFSISVGNQIDLSAVDCLQWFLTPTKNEILNAEKAKIQVFGIYIEGLLQDEGLRLMRLVAEAKRQKKLVIIYKAGRSKHGSEAVSGHTASLAGSYEQFSSLVDLAGGVICERADDFEDMIFGANCLINKLAKATFSQFPQVSGQSNAGFERCAIADHLFSDGFLQLSEFDSNLIQQLKDLFKKYKLESVIDVQSILDTTALIPDSAYAEISQVLLGSAKVEAGVISLIPEIQTIKTLKRSAAHPEDDCEAVDSVIQLYIKLWQKTDFVWVFSMSCGSKYDYARKIMMESGMPVFDQVDRASRVLQGLLRSWVGKFGGDE